MTTDELRQAYRTWRSIQLTEVKLAAYRESEYDGRVVQVSLQEKGGPPSDEYSATFVEPMVREAIIDALIQRLGVYYAELAALGVTPGPPALSE
jgi:hypothetical protein